MRSLALYTSPCYLCWWTLLSLAAVNLVLLYMVSHFPSPGQCFTAGSCCKRGHKPCGRWGRRNSCAGGEDKTRDTAALSKTRFSHSPVPSTQPARQSRVQLVKGAAGTGTERDTIRAWKLCCYLQDDHRLFGETRLAA